MACEVCTGAVESDQAAANVGLQGNHLAKHFLNALEAAGKLVGTILVQVSLPVAVALSLPIVVSPAAPVAPLFSSPSSMIIITVWPLPMAACICNQAGQVTEGSQMCLPQVSPPEGAMIAKERKSAGGIAYRQQHAVLMQNCVQCLCPL